MDDRSIPELVAKLRQDAEDIRNKPKDERLFSERLDRAADVLEAQARELDATVAELDMLRAEIARLTRIKWRENALQVGPWIIGTIDRIGGAWFAVWGGIREPMFRRTTEAEARAALEQAAREAMASRLRGGARSRRPHP